MIYMSIQNLLVPNDYILHVGDQGIIKQVTNSYVEYSGSGVIVAAGLMGYVVQCNAAGAITLTLPNAADLIAAYPYLQVGEGFDVRITLTSGQIGQVVTIANSVDGLVQLIGGNAGQIVISAIPNTAGQFVMEKILTFAYIPEGNPVTREFAVY